MLLGDRTPESAETLQPAGPARSIVAVSLNVWGLKFISKDRHARAVQIGAELDRYSPRPDIVALQECFCRADFEAVHERTRGFLPHARFFRSGVFGSGLVILSRWPITESSMTGYTLNGLPWAVHRGDWYVGKGFAQARIEVPAGAGGLAAETIDVFNTHLHAPYHPPDRDFYLPHRITQAWQLAKALRLSRSSRDVSLVLALGDYNSRPDSLPYRIITAHGRVRDSWREAYRPAALVPADPRACTAGEAVRGYGATADSSYNTWRWDKPVRKQLRRLADEEAIEAMPNPRAQRLDYVFYALGGKRAAAGAAGKRGGGGAAAWRADSSRVGMMMKHPTLNCSLSDHFSVDTVLSKVPLSPRALVDLTDENTNYNNNSSNNNWNDDDDDDDDDNTTPPLPKEDYEQMLEHVTSFKHREMRVRRYRLAHFVVELVVAVACLTAIFFSPSNKVSFGLAAVAAIGLAAGLIDGLMGGLFVSSELSGLSEFECDIQAKIAALNRIERF